MKIGIDIGGSHIGVAIVNKNGEILKKIEQDIEKQDDMAQYILDYVDKAIQELVKNADIEEIGIAVPGNSKRSKVTNLVNLGIDEINFEPIKEKYKVPLKIINDAKAAAIAEKQYGALQQAKDSVFLCLGTGIGGAVFLNHQLLKANKNPGFELGHIVIDRHGVECHCGKKGCFETYCSMKRLKEKLQMELEKITNNNGKRIQIKDVNILKQELQEHIENSKIQNILNEYINNLVIGLSNIIDIFEPEIICMGGSFVYFKDILYDRFITQMKEQRYVFNKNSLPKIQLAQLGNDAGIIGATLIDEKKKNK